MNTRYCSSASFLEGGQIVAVNSPTRPSPPLLIRLAIKVSRARWYSFLRRVFHYQNGSGPNPFNSRNWMLIESIALAVQISASAYTLMASNGERPVWPMRVWISGYALACLSSLILLSWRYRIIVLERASDIEQQQSHQESRKLQYMHNCRASLDLLYAIWFVIGNVWVFGSRFGSFHRAPKLHILCISLLAWNALSYSFPFILFVLLCCCVPLLSTLLGYNMNTAARDRGATDGQLATLSSWKFQEVGHNPSKPIGISECCICLGKFRDKEEIRQLPCTHIFHLNCVDQWLKIIACCPLCKQGIDK